MQMHEVGECPYGDKECSGAGSFAPDPFAQEIYDDDTEAWNCDAGYYESAMEI